MRIVDTKGQLCPKPLIAAKKALKETVVGESFMLLTDNQTSFNNLSRYLKDNNTTFLVDVTGGIWTLTITKSIGDITPLKAEEFCDSSISHFQKGDFIIVVSSDKMGEGDDDLGHLLMSNFINALKDLDRLPEKMVFYNKGVTLVTRNSPVIEHLKDLEKMGVKFLLCGTCVNHYSIQSEVEIGILSNMFEIADVMTTAGRVVSP